jgi:hypothetical protein
MPPLGRYRFNSPTLALLEEAGRHIARTVPAGSVVEGDGAIERDRLVKVQWDGKRMMMFAQDLRSRAELIEQK